jgi:hypothetical protein
VKVRQLIDLLSDYSPEAEVRLAIQPRYPLEAHVAGVVSQSEIRAHLDKELGDDEPEVVFVLEGAQIGYGNRVAWEAAEQG